MPNKPVWVSITNDKEYLDVDIEGSFKKVYSNYSFQGQQKEFRQSFKPSYLVYWMKNEKIKLFWGTGLWLIGLFWSFKDSFFENN
jgi:hypothetical protein